MTAGGARSRPGRHHRHGGGSRPPSACRCRSGCRASTCSEQVAKTAGGYPYLTVNAYNPWALLTQAATAWPRTARWIRDVDGPDPARSATPSARYPGSPRRNGAAAPRSSPWSSWSSRRRPDRLTILVGARRARASRSSSCRRASTSAILPVLRPRRDPCRRLVPLAARLRRPRGREFPEHVRGPDHALPGQPGDLATGSASGPPSARPDDHDHRVVHLVGFVWVILRSSGRGRESTLVAEIEVGPRARRGAAGRARRRSGRSGPASGATAGRPPGPATASAGSRRSTTATAPDRRLDAGRRAPRLARRRPPSGADPGWRVGSDRSAPTAPAPTARARLHGEPAGASTGSTSGSSSCSSSPRSCLRTFRLSEPYPMHFDEVYHARTATEFLQDWRYGIPHDIYEYTHPHLAKYAMAAGLVAVRRRPGHRPRRPRRAGPRRPRRAALGRPVAAGRPRRRPALRATATSVRGLRPRRPASSSRRGRPGRRQPGARPGRSPGARRDRRRRDPGPRHDLELDALRDAGRSIAHRRGTGPGRAGRDRRAGHADRPDR